MIISVVVDDDDDDDHISFQLIFFSHRATLFIYIYIKLNLFFLI